MSAKLSIAILDDYQQVALRSADWSRVMEFADLQTFHEPWRDEEQAAEALRSFDVLVLMRERTPLPASLIRKLPHLKLVALTGTRTNSIDLEACASRRILVSHTTRTPSTSAAELAVALMLACSRALPNAFEGMAAGRWQTGVPMGVALEGKRVGVLGLGQLGSKVARVCKAFGMDVVAWSQNLKDADAHALGVMRVEKDELFATADVVSLHLALSDRTRRIVGLAEISAMKRGAILVNTARAALVDQTAMMRALEEGRIAAGLDVFEVEPLPAAHPLRALPNVVLTPHLGYVVNDVFEQYYRDIVESIVAWRMGAPIRLLS